MGERVEHQREHARGAVDLLRHGEGGGERGDSHTHLLVELRELRASHLDLLFCHKRGLVGLGQHDGAVSEGVPPEEVGQEGERVGRLLQQHELLARDEHARHPDAERLGLLRERRAGRERDRT